MGWTAESRECYRPRGHGYRSGITDARVALVASLMPPPETWRAAMAEQREGLSGGLGTMTDFVAPGKRGRRLGQGEERSTCSASLRRSTSITFSTATQCRKSAGSTT